VQTINDDAGRAAIVAHQRELGRSPPDDGEGPG
jgi:hypothetical protein